MKSDDVELLIQQVQSSKPMDSAILDDFIQVVAQRSIDIKLVERWLKVVHSNGISVAETTQLTKGMMLSGAVGGAAKVQGGAGPSTPQAPSIDKSFGEINDVLQQR